LARLIGGQGTMALERMATWIAAGVLVMASGL
jgi:hypothetical protein